MAHTRSGLVRDTARPIFPISLGSPVSRRFQVSPPSTVLQIPLAGPPLRPFHGVRWVLHIAAYRMRGLEGSIARSLGPASESGEASNSFQVRPPSALRYTPRSALRPQRLPCAAT